MIREKCQRCALRAAKEKERLLQLHLIISTYELKTKLSEIELRKILAIPKRRRKNLL